jgi:hypothetical protein
LVPASQPWNRSLRCCPTTDSRRLQKPRLTLQTSVVVTYTAERSKPQKAQILLSLRQPLSPRGAALPFVISTGAQRSGEISVLMSLLGNVFRRSVPGFPTSPLSPATTHVVLRKENHTQLTEAATLDRKSGEAEGPAVQRTFVEMFFKRAPPIPISPICHRPSLYPASRTRPPGRQTPA